MYWHRQNTSPQNKVAIFLVLILEYDINYSFEHKHIK